MIVFFNALGFAFVAIGFALAITIFTVAGLKSEGAFMLIFGPIVAAADLCARRLHKDRDLFSSNSGGQLFFLPVWMFGIFWVICGTIDLVRG